MLILGLEAFWESKRGGVLFGRKFLGRLGSLYYLRWWVTVNTHGISYTKGNVSQLVLLSTRRGGFLLQHRRRLVRTWKTVEGDKEAGETLSRRAKSGWRRARWPALKGAGLFTCLLTFADGALLLWNMSSDDERVAAPPAKMETKRKTAPRACDVCRRKKGACPFIPARRRIAS